MTTGAVSRPARNMRCLQLNRPCGKSGSPPLLPFLRLLTMPELGITTILRKQVVVTPLPCTAERPLNFMLRIAVER